MVVWLRTCTRRIHVHGQHHVPPQGPVVFLLAGGAASSFYLLLAGTRRFVRFVLPPSFCHSGWVRSALRSLGGVCLPEAPSVEQERHIAETMRRALERGDSVAALPPLPDAVSEGLPTLSRSALARILTTDGVAVVPVRIERLDRRLTVEFREPWDGRADLGSWLESVRGGLDAPQ
jgi:hypothetical protein